jgi:deoxyribonuclease-2
MSNNLAHAKGVMAFDGNTGFFLRHSTPRFPDKASLGPYAGFPSYARIYGQTFLCVSYSMANLNQIATQFLVNDANIYDSLVSPATASRYPAIGALAAGNRQKSYTSVKSILSLGGMNFTDFAKSKACNCELYTQLVAPEYRSNMAVLSWGRPLMGSGCRPFVPYDVLDISGMTLNTPTGTISYNETKEHSKLGLVEQGNAVCVGDINRMTSQATRGGGTTCFSNASLWNALAKEIGDWKTCSH